MESSNIPERYQDSPSTSRSSSPAISNVAPTPKPLPSLPIETSISPEEPYRDEPSTRIAGPTIVSPQPQRYPINREEQQCFPPYTDHIPGLEDNDDVPLAHLYPYPTEAPPAYHVAVRQSYPDTLILHIPGSTVPADLDVEAGVEREDHDDIRFRVERIIAAFMIAFFLFIFSALLFSFVFFFRS